MERGDIDNVKKFYKVLKEIRKTRKKVLSSILKGEEIPQKYVEKIQKILLKLKSIPGDEDNHIIYSNQNDRIMMKLDYEIEGLRKDLIYLKQGENGLEDYLVKNNESFDDEKKEVVDYLTGKAFDSFVGNRDWALNYPADRYESSIQTIYNAFYLDKFLNKINNKILITSAPLNEFSFVNIMPEKDMVLAGSRGRKFIYNGNKKSFYVPWKEGKKLGKLHSRIKRLLRDEDYEKLVHVGSGIQEKFGGITVARQDRCRSVDKRISNNFLEEVKEIARSIDPKGEYFEIKDTGLDVQINLKWGLKLFDKGSGLGFILNSLNKSLGKVLICGDSESDLSIVEKAKKDSEEMSVIFVTKDNNLKKRVKGLCPDAKFVSNPDTLVSSLKASSNKIKKSKKYT